MRQVPKTRCNHVVATRSPRSSTAKQKSGFSGFAAAKNKPGSGWAPKYIAILVRILNLCHPQAGRRPTRRPEWPRRPPPVKSCTISITRQDRGPRPPKGPWPPITASYRLGGTAAPRGAYPSRNCSARPRAQHVSARATRRGVPAAVPPHHRMVPDTQQLQFNRNGLPRGRLRGSPAAELGSHATGLSGIYT